MGREPSFEITCVFKGKESYLLLVSQQRAVWSPLNLAPMEERLPGREAALLFCCAHPLPYLWEQHNRGRPQGCGPGAGVAENTIISVNLLSLALGTACCSYSKEGLFSVSAVCLYNMFLFCFLSSEDATHGVLTIQDLICGQTEVPHAFISLWHMPFLSPPRACFFLSYLCQSAIKLYNLKSRIPPWALYYYYLLHVSGLRKLTIWNAESSTRKGACLPEGDRRRQRRAEWCKMEVTVLLIFPSQYYQLIGMNRLHYCKFLLNKQMRHTCIQKRWRGLSVAGIALPLVWCASCCRSLPSSRHG